MTLPIPFRLLVCISLSVSAWAQCVHGSNHCAICYQQERRNRELEEEAAARRAAREAQWEAQAEAARMAEEQRRIADDQRQAAQRAAAAAAELRRVERVRAEELRRQQIRKQQAADLNDAVDKVLNEPTNPSATDEGSFASDLLDELPGRADIAQYSKNVTERMAQIAGDSNRTAAERFGASLLGTATQAFTGETTMKEYGQSSEKVGSALEGTGSLISLLPGGQASGAWLQGMGAGFQFGGKMLQVVDGEDVGVASVTQSAADMLSSVVEGGHLGAFFDGAKIAAQLAPGKDQDITGAAFAAIGGLDKRFHDGLLTKELGRLRREASLSGWTASDLNGRIVPELKAAEVHEYLRQVPAAAKDVVDKGVELLDALKPTPTERKK
ncbi:MAG: hypothetical protein MUC36_18070 [Planctomycetes bacterium]|nr:hypothetical protein [Planctomycetota bacterium]